MVKIPRQKIKPMGNSFSVGIPKALLNCEVLESEKEYDVYLVPIGTQVKIKKEENSVCLIRTTDRRKLLQNLAYC